MSTRKKANSRAPGTGIRAALKQRKTRLEHFDIPLVESDVADEKARALTKARNDLDMINLVKVDDEELIARHHTAVDTAQAEVDACYHRVSFRGLSADDFDALVNEHPPTEDQAKAEHTWNPDTFFYALIVACVVDGDGMTDQDWRTELARPEWSRADLAALRGAVFAANQRGFSEGIPKG